MGVEYRHFVIPRDNTVRPAPEQVAALIEAWLAAGFVARPGSAAHQRMTFGATKTSLAAKDTGAILLTKPLTAAPFPVPPSPDAMRILAGPEALIRWPVENLAQADLQYPLTPVPDFGRRGEGAYGEGPYYDLELHLSDDFIHTDSETIDVLPQTSCDCGTQLEYEPDLEDVFFAARIRRLCPACGRAFRPQDQMATIRWLPSPTASQEPVQSLPAAQLTASRFRSIAANAFNPDPRLPSRSSRLVARPFAAICTRSAPFSNLG